MTLRQAVEALRNDIDGPSSDMRVDASYVKARLTAALALPDGPRKCGECQGSGRTDNHVTGEVECGSCEGSGEQPEGPEPLLNAARAEAVLEYASEEDAFVGGPYEGAHRAHAVAYAKAKGWLTQGPHEAPTACTDCPRCGDRVRTSDLRSWQVCEQTHTEPAEYEDGCMNCCPREEQ